METTRKRSLDSPRKRIPRMATPTAPMPVHTAYAVPTGNVFNDRDNRYKLATIERPVNTDGTSLVHPSVYFRPIAHPISNKPATNR
jgi:hypothetical protein